MSEPAILAIDQGTGSTKVLLVDVSGRVRARGSAPLERQTPQPGWVEHRGEDILASVQLAIDDAMAQSGELHVVAVGISNQRESMLLWEGATGRAISPVLSWQDRRTVDLCQRLTDAGHGELVRRISGLPLDPMFSAVKAAWLLDTYDPERRLSTDLRLGTIDSWLLWHLTGEHVIEAGNASRTSLVDLTTGQWSPELLSVFGIPWEVLPRIVDSVGVIGSVRGVGGLDGVPVTGVLGDSHAALFAHAGWRSGVAKATYGTGSSVMTLIPEGAPDSDGLCRTIAWRLPGEEPALAWEANILSAGSTLTWLASVLDSSVEDLVGEAAADSAGVVLVPAFNGLGAPWWDPAACATVTGLSLSTTRAHLGRAALDSVVMQVADVLHALRAASTDLDVLLVDGGMTGNRDLMGRQVAVSDVRVEVSTTAELSALGAAQAAGLGAGLWTMADLDNLPREYEEITAVDVSVHLHSQWRDALRRSQGPGRESTTVESPTHPSSTRKPNAREDAES